MSEKLASKVLAKIEELPPFSKIANQALIAEREKIANGTYVSPDGFYDPVFAKQVLQMTNFANFSFLGEKLDLGEKDNFLVDDVLRGVMLAYAIQEFIKVKLDWYGLSEDDLWEHSMNCALSAWMIATKVAFKDLETAFVAGLMHDIGKVVLDEFLYEEKDKLVDISQEDAALWELEYNILGIDHAAVGAKIAEKWGFSDKVVEAIKYHHLPGLAENEPDLVTIIHLADVICQSLGLALKEDNLFGLLAGNF